MKGSTKNSLDIPVASRYNGLEMHLGGESSLKISGKYGTVSWRWVILALIELDTNSQGVQQENCC